jgi:hypothetical protein
MPELSGIQALQQAIDKKRQRRNEAATNSGGFVCLPDPLPVTQQLNSPAPPTKRDGKASPAGGVVPLLYGRRKIPGLFVYLKMINFDMHGVWIFAKGELEQCEEIQLNGKPLSSYVGVTSQVFTGTQTQPVCNLHNYDAAWTDALAGIAYCYLIIGNASDIQDLPRVEGVWRGRKVYDHRSGATAYSTNPVLAIADILMDPTDGGRIGSNLIDWSSVDAAANYCDADIGGGQRRFEFSYYFGQETTLGGVIETMRRHCLGIVKVGSAGNYTIDIAKKRDAVESFVENEVWNLQIPMLNSSDIVNCVSWTWTDPATWESVNEVLYDPDLGETDEINERQYDLTGCVSLSNSTRLATFLLNARLSNLRLSFSTFNYKGLQPLDVFTITHSIGVTAKKMQVTSVSMNQDGSAQITAAEYDDACYSDTIVSEPTYGDTTLPDPTATPADPLNLQAQEQIVQLLDATVISVIRITWQKPPVSFFDHFEVYSKEGSGAEVLIGTTQGLSAEIRGAVQGVAYTIRVKTVSRWGKASSGATITVTAQGKVLAPTWKNGAAITGTEAGDVVFLRWAMPDGSAPAFDIDALQYEVRRGATSGAWDSATFVARGFFTVFQDRGCPAGTWRYFVRAVDSVGNYTETDLYCDVTVTINPNLGSVNMTVVGWNTGTFNSTIMFGEPGSRSVCPISASYDVLSERFPGANFNSANVHTRLSHPANTSGSDVTTPAYDLGYIKSATFIMSVTTTKLGSGSADVSYQIGLSNDNSNYSWYGAGSLSGGITPVVGTGRYFKIKFTFTSGSADDSIVISQPCSMTTKTEIVGEYGTVTVTGGSLTITFKNTYNSIEKVRLTAKAAGSGTYDPLTVVYDNLTTSGMTIKMFDKSNNAYAGECRYEVEGT